MIILHFYYWHIFGGITSDIMTLF